MTAHEETVARLLTVRGHVQGVFFRDSTRREAQRRSVRGWAANLPDGSVEVFLEGRPADVEAVLRYRYGPQFTTPRRGDKGVARRYSMLRSVLEDLQDNLLGIWAWLR